MYFVQRRKVYRLCSKEEWAAVTAFRAQLVTLHLLRPGDLPGLAGEASLTQ